MIAALLENPCRDRDDVAEYDATFRFIEDATRTLACPSVCVIEMNEITCAVTYRDAYTGTRRRFEFDAQDITEVIDDACERHSNVWIAVPNLGDPFKRDVFDLTREVTVARRSVFVGANRT